MITASSTTSLWNTTAGRSLYICRLLWATSISFSEMLPERSTSTTFSLLCFLLTHISPLMRRSKITFEYYFRLHFYIIINIIFFFNFSYRKDQFLSSFFLDPPLRQDSAVDVARHLGGYKCHGIRRLTSLQLLRRRAPAGRQEAFPASLICNSPLTQT